jgi:hypothetical protein
MWTFSRCFYASAHTLLVQRLYVYYVPAHVSREKKKFRPMHSGSGPFKIKKKMPRQGQYGLGARARPTAVLGTDK